MQKLCAQKFAIEKCGCRLQGHFTRFDKTDNPSCGKYILLNETKGQDMLKCERGLSQEWSGKIKNYGEYCNCSWPCDDITYFTHSSSAVWPSQNTWQSFLHSIEESSQLKNTKPYQYYQLLKSNNASNEEIYSWVQKHFLKLNVFANSIVVSVTKEIPKYTTTDLFCNICGCLGLWVGMSIITLSEAIDLFVRLFLKMFTSQVTSVG